LESLILITSMLTPCVAFTPISTTEWNDFCLSSIPCRQARSLTKSHHDIIGKVYLQRRRSTIVSSTNNNEDDNKNSNNINDANTNNNNNNNNIIDSFFNQFWNSIGMSPSSSESNRNTTSPSSQKLPRPITNNNIDNLFGFHNRNEPIINPTRTRSDDRYDEENDDDDSNQAAGTFTVIKIPVKELKPGGLRLFLMFYLMGMQNTPNRNTWRANQPDRTRMRTGSTSPEEEYVVDFRYVVDNSAALSIVLRPHSIRIYRIGSTPSNSYMMQEALVLQGILNELDQCATDDRIQMENRLLILHENNSGAIHNAKDALSFG
jgi:hypothetical protein